jgi:integrase
MYGEGRVYWKGPADEPEGIKAKRGSYHIAFCVKGREVRMSAKTRNKTIATAKLRDEIRKSRGDHYIDPRDRHVTVGELVRDLEEHYLATGKDAFADDLETRWRLHLAKTFDSMPAVNLTTETQRAYRLARKDAAPATINRELQIIRRAFRLASENEPPKVARVPKFLIHREENARKEFFTREEVDRVRAAASKEGLWARVMIEIAYTLGWRRGEILSLRVRDFNVADGTVRLETSKNHEPRECPLESATATMMHQLVSRRDPDEFIFPGRDTQRGAWARIQKAAKTNKLFHSFRRTAARDKRATGTDSSVIMAMQGWKSDAMFRRYAIVNVADQRAALARLAQHSPKSTSEES